MNGPLVRFLALLWRPVPVLAVTGLCVLAAVGMPWLLASAGVWLGGPVEDGPAAVAAAGSPLVVGAWVADDGLGWTVFSEACFLASGFLVLARLGLGGDWRLPVWLGLRTLVIGALVMGGFPFLTGAHELAEPPGGFWAVSGFAAVAGLGAAGWRLERVVCSPRPRLSVAADGGEGFSAGHAWMLVTAMAVCWTGGWLAGFEGWLRVLFLLLSADLSVWAVMQWQRRPCKVGVALSGWGFHATFLCLAVGLLQPLDVGLPGFVQSGLLVALSLFWLLHVFFRCFALGHVGAAPVCLDVPDKSPMAREPAVDTDALVPRDLPDETHSKQREFLATMSHELRTPLSCIVGLARLWTQDGGVPDDAKQDMGTIERMAVQLLRIVDSGLSFVSNENSSSVPDVDSVKMRLLMRDLYAMGEWLASQQGNRFVMERIRHVPSTLIFDERRTRQVLINLLSNSAKFCQHGTLSVGVDLRKTGQGYFLNWVVRDTGRGMDADEQARYFSAFTKSMDSTGLGLGLALVRRMVDEMGGSIEIRSSKGKGTAVALLIPVHLVKHARDDSLFSTDTGRSAYFPPSAPMDLLPRKEFVDLDFVSLRRLIRLGQISEIGEWIESAKALDLPQEARDLVQQLHKAYLRVDLNAMQCLLDQADTPLSFV